MFDLHKRPEVGQLLRSLAGKAEWIAYLVFGAWLGRYLVAQDPVALLAGVVSFVLIELGGMACRQLADKCSNTSTCKEGDANDDVEVDEETLNDAGFWRAHNPDPQDGATGS